MNIYKSHFYVYLYLREDFTPYYVGKGSGKRAYKKHKGEVYPPKNKSKIILIETELSEIQSFILERYYIRWFGRKDNNTGILRNKTDGGEGFSGIIVSEELRRERSIRMSGENNIMFGSKRTGKDNPFYGQKHKEESKSKMGPPKGYKKPDILCKKQSEFMKINNPMSNPDSIEKIRLKALSRPKIKCLFCDKECDPGNFTKYHGDKCKFKS
jgi:hypothetical protein